MLQSKTDNPLDGLHLETYVRADADGVASCAAGLLAARCAEAVSYTHLSGNPFSGRAA